MVRLRRTMTTISPATITRCAIDARLLITL